MGLDTVELVIEFEQKFRVNIPDQEAAKLVTVRQAAELILKYVQLREPERDLFGEVLARIRAALDATGIRPGELNPGRKLNTIFSGAEVASQWQQFAHALGLHIPALAKADLGETVEPKASKRFGITTAFNRFTQPDPPFLEHDVSRLVDCICGLNHEKFIDFDHLTSRYEVMVAVMVITSDKSGVEVTDIFPDSSFTSDLGMD